MTCHSNVKTEPVDVHTPCEVLLRTPNEDSGHTGRPCETTATGRHVV